MSESNEYKIAVDNVYKTFNVYLDKANTIKEKLLFLFSRNKKEKREVLKGINLKIKQGEVVALIGTNGSGKSTLLKLMTQIIYPNKGKIITNGKLTSLLELGAGFHPDFSGRENIYFNASIFGLTRKEIDQRIDKIIEFSELEDFIDNPIRTYSSGMYMRLAFSVAINVDADILLIDEILAVGDQHFQDKCYAKLEELKDSGKTIVIVTHSLGEVKKLCHRAIWIYKGELKLDGDPIYVIDEYLKQSAIDHKEERKKAKEKGEFKSKTIMYVDSPRDLAVVKNVNKMLLRGWKISDEENTKLKVFIDDQEIEGIQVQPRPDVYEAYMEQFDGMLDSNQIGWKKEFDVTKLGIGKHFLKVICLDEKDNELSSKEVEFSKE